jgi:hypothetical protein
MTKPKREVVIEQDPEAPVEKAVLATTIVRISEAMAKLLSSGLNERAIVVLLHDAIPARGKYGGQGKITRSEIQSVLDALRDLKRRYAQ